MKIRFILAIALSTLLLVGGMARAVEYPAQDGFVVDTAGVLDDASQQNLEDTIAALDKSTGAQVGVAVIPTLDGEPVENYAIKLFEKWGIGQDKEDNGVLLVVAVKDRKMRIEVGYGLEGAIPDIRAKEITGKIIGPKFKAGDMAGGVLDGVNAIIGDICKEYGVSVDEVMAGKIADKASSKTSGDEGENGSPLLFFGLFGGIIVFLIFTVIKGWRRPHTGIVDILGDVASSSISDSSSGSDSGGFDGGDSGGGGASDDW
jgi:uncharacterized protein